MKISDVKLMTGNESGRSLVEVMISLTIGMVIVIALSAMFMANRQTYRASDDKSRLDDEGRLALNLMAFHVRMAGYGSLLSTNERYEQQNNAAGTATSNKPLPAIYTNNSNENGVSVNAIRGCAGGFTDTSVDVSVLSCKPGGESDSFLVRYVVDQFSANVDADGTPTDSLGAALALSPATLGTSKKAPSGAFHIVENRFFVQMNNGVPELYSQGNGGTAPGESFKNSAQPIAENVEQMKITYGVSSNNGQTVDTFLTADRVQDWEGVISVRICLVVRSANDRVTQTKQTYRDCGNAEVTAADYRLRGVFSTTITIRSRSVGATW